VSGTVFLLVFQPIAAYLIPADVDVCGKNAAILAVPEAVRATARAAAQVSAKIGNEDVEHG
jgi:hypothetical protein